MQVPKWFYIITALATTMIASSCDLGGVNTLPDVSSVTTYIVHCDSTLKAHHCYGPTQRVSDEVFAVIISRQAVIILKLAGFQLAQPLHQFSDCLVAAPRRWDCMDDRRQPVSMIGDELRWAELDNAKQASVSKIEYYGFWSALIH
jgi:hypothetical protein